MIGRARRGNLRGMMIGGGWLLVVWLSATVLAQGKGKLPYPQLEKKGYSRAAVCGRCHTLIYQTWKDTLHARSLVDPIFDTAYLEAYRMTQGKAKTFCLACHAPTTHLTQDFEVRLEITQEGITCDFCHTLQGVKLAPRGLHELKIGPGRVKWGPHGREKAPVHEVAASRLFEDALLCAGCHEYVTPQGVVVLGTYSEWLAGFYGRQGVPCQRCHMPVSRREGGFLTEGGRTPQKEINLHAIAGGSSVPQLKKMLKVRIASAERLGDRVRVTVEITNHGAGHQIPTGLPTKRLVLTAKATTARGKSLVAERSYRKVLLDAQGREITRDVDAFLSAAQLSSDNRIKPKETRREVFFFFIPRGTEAVISAQVAYAYRPRVIDQVETVVDLAQDERVFNTR
ncbi:MAG: hypothetical protein HYY20_04795 [Candidatus Tectomicrobia bacterium]|uniref:Cytochrome c-552/4 domain-containing protein n=1 Tax=Tectimicrobiota bacterium TaxID=2528274 RepID=A0A932FY73_UNCTE|nr:hypothetical protein [Candidatus Tectomicrobia bacterium]